SNRSSRLSMYPTIRGSIQASIAIRYRKARRRQPAMPGSGYVSCSVKNGATNQAVLLAKRGPRRYQWRVFSRRSSAVEHPLRKRVVGGSNPSAGTNFFKLLKSKLERTRAHSWESEKLKGKFRSECRSASQR